MHHHISRCCKAPVLEDTDQTGFVCQQCRRACKIIMFKYDLFLNGPPDRYSNVLWKAAIKTTFPDLIIYDPEDDSSEDWFTQDHKRKNNLETIERAIADSTAMVTLLPNHPLPPVGLYAGMHWLHHHCRGCLIFLWRQPQGQKVVYVEECYSHLGQVFYSLDETVKYLAQILGL
ncbi:MAG: hypothetical protein A3B89_01905 [Candidatus Buchananbacteria bacterium RIFCSPHIGHO2_02_FULL_40_13]|uniref:Uncharacterized protein n=1 Tax=Candidatus Buchananbacteria bacterium RIFCSPLOWO2_01_FULL_39_33 TaxID=1797543 RepID=A0A1G1YJQ0_9BACT|nr:MAG: hypothetical protein A2820_03700 [Candidatus Buchananbacteria bacterium RIFCSPHIGHO2_01_FULL_40_35]OGY50532.1 MAG: hypothetical protein A3B89_01905 [Candidatus Buchananbacteria bacterium RIFCSPHIGHO2_02_FULL_40_13]OGY52578.1 MAG: hypothetical protein A3A02_00940 [Candidatus Buchananbacteria bacterium RIFCSPLOWO2_01_FULL_39_33]